MASVDLEKGLGESRRASAIQQNSSANTSDRNDKPYKSDLEIFQTLVGIHFLVPGGDPNPDTSKQIQPASPMADIFLPGKAAGNRFRNRGLYDRALSQDLKNRTMYSIARYVVVFLYLFQIVIAATFTALSAFQNSSVATLTTLGAINTVVAGMLAWVTGQGMPVRFRRARNQYREVVKAIEAAERTFSEIESINWPPGQRPDPIKERDRLERIYEEARLDQEANYPETQHEPNADKHAQKNAELQDKVSKKKGQGKEMEAIRRELDTLRNSGTVQAEGTPGTKE